MALKTWLGTSGGLWSQASQWSPSGAPTRADDAEVVGAAPVTNTTVVVRPQPFQTIIGPGFVASLTLEGNTALVGAFTTSRTQIGTSFTMPGGGQGRTQGGLRVGAGSNVDAGSMSVVFGFVQVAGAGAVLSMDGRLALGGGYPFVATSLDISGGASVQAGNLDLVIYVDPSRFQSTYGTVGIDAVSRMDVGWSRTAAAGTLLVEAGHEVDGAGAITAANGIVNDGVITAAYGTLNLASPVTGVGELNIRDGGTLAPHGTAEAVRFLDATGTLALYLGNNKGVPTLADGVGAINGFGLGDRITFTPSIYGQGNSAPLTGMHYRAAGNGMGTLTLTAGFNVVGTLTMAGDYTGQAFRIASSGAGTLASTLTVAPSGPPPGDAFLFTDAGGVSGGAAGDAYDGPVAGLDWQYIWSGTGGAALAATVGNVFLHGGAGDDALQVKGGFNVLDGGGGSNFLVGGTGADGGADTFFVDGRGFMDGRGGPPVWSTVVNFHRGDAVTLFGFVADVSTRPWSAAEGALGYTGATIHSELGGAGTGVNASLTFTRISLADAQARFTTSTGTVGGTPYLSIVYA